MEVVSKSLSVHTMYARGFQRFKYCRVFYNEDFNTLQGHKFYSTRYYKPGGI